MKKTGVGEGTISKWDDYKRCSLHKLGTTRRKRKGNREQEAPEATLTEFPQINAGFPTADPGRPGNTEQDTLKTTTPGRVLFKNT